MSELDRVIPPPPPIFNAFTGELIERDDLEALRAGLAAIDEFLDELHGKHRNVYESRRRILARIGELSPVDLPARRNQTDKQAKIERCPRCRTRLPRVVIRDAEEG